MNNVLGILEAKGYIEDISGEEKRKKLSITEEGNEILNYYVGLENLVQISIN